MNLMHEVVGRPEKSDSDGTCCREAEVCPGDDAQTCLRNSLPAGYTNPIRSLLHPNYCFLNCTHETTVSLM